MNDKGKFERDLNLLVKKLNVKTSKKTKRELEKLRGRLVELQKKNVVKINHSVMELVCAKYLIAKGCKVQIEYPLSSLLTCDLFAEKGYGNLIVEIETGYIPPEYALRPLSYTSARLASKIIRYSSFVGKFTLGVPPHYILPFPKALALPPRERTELQLENIKNLCDLYYKSPPVTKDDIKNARIQEIYVIDVDRTCVQEIDPGTYLKRAMQNESIFAFEEDAISEKAG